MIAQVLNRTDKVIQLRILVGLLGLESPTTSTSKSTSSANVVSSSPTDPDETTPEIYRILQQAQTSGYEDWVRSIAGLIQGIMFQDQQDGSRESCRGEEAKVLLETAARDILQPIQELLVVTIRDDDDNDDNDDDHTATGTATATATPDMNTFFAPYRYALIQHSLLVEILPECTSNPHFVVNQEAEFLTKDEEMELKKAREEQEHKLPTTTTIKTTTTTATALSSSSTMPNGNGTTTTQPLPAGFRPTKLVKDPAKGGGKLGLPAKPKTNMFMPTKKPIGATTAGRGSQQLQQRGGAGGGAGGSSGAGMIKPTLHTRKAGAAQALLMKSKLQQRLAAKGVMTGHSNLPGGHATTAATGGKFGAGRAALKSNTSKMKMIDVSEVDTLNKEQAKREEQGTMNHNTSMSSRKRKILDAAAQKGLKKGGVTKREVTIQAADHPANDSRPPAASTDLTSPKPTADSATATGTTSATTASNMSDLASATLTSAAEPAMDPLQQLQLLHQSAGRVPPASYQQQQQQQQSQAIQQPAEWQLLLKDRSNKLSDQDRARVVQFFELHVNPTPEQPVYKMKLHEERTTDPRTGQAIKETYYLELDYSTFTSKQSKKVKRY